jgi:hypothetical protein
MNRCPRYLLLVLAWLCWSNGQGAEPITRNPFTRPGYTADRPLPTNTEVALLAFEPLQLKATLIAGQQALANINGEILAPGDEIQGHRLLQVREREVVLSKDGERLTLSVDSEKEENRRD